MGFMSQEKLSLFEAFPNDMLTEIMSRVGSHSQQDLKACMLTSEEFLGSVHDPQIFKTLNISDVVNRPLLARTLRNNVFQKCLHHSNPSALYIEGILEYFVDDNSLGGICYLKQAADACVQEAIYLYGILKVARGDFTEGSCYMEKLNWRANTEHVVSCWNNTKGSLYGIHVEKKLIYFESLTNMKPEGNCNIYNIYRGCPKCYYYKQLVKFIFSF